MSTAISAKQVKDLRDKTGAGMMDCKKALEETSGDVEAAVTLLRKKGIAAADKRAGRAANEGLCDSYIHQGGRVGVLVEVNCETDFVARSEPFRGFVHDVAIQIAALNPLFVIFGGEELPLAENVLDGLFPVCQALLEAKLAVVMEPTGNQLQAGCLGNIKAELLFEGLAAHSARPWLGRNAIHEAVRGLRGAL